MNDTSPRAAAMVLRLLRQRTPAQCVAMMSDMFQASRALMASALRAAGLTEHSLEWKLAVLDRTYGAEISARQRERLATRWAADARRAFDAPRPSC